MTRRLMRLMPMFDDPETPSAVRDVLRAGREDAVADYDFDAGLARHLGVIASGVPMPDWAKGLEGAGGGGGAATTATAAGAGASALSGAVAWVIVPVVTAAVVAGALWSSAPAPTSAPQAAAPTVGLHPAQPLSPSPAPAPAAAPAVAVPAAGEAMPVEPASNQAPAVAPAPRARAQRASGVDAKTRGPAASSTAAASAVSAKSGDLFANAPRVTRSVDRSTEATREQAVRESDDREQAAAPQPQVPARIDDARLEREMGMLAVAQRVLQADPARALNLVRQSAREFGDTMFAPERGQLELLSLVKLGRIDEAKRLARPYLARYPNGPFSDRVRRALASGRVDR